MVRTSFAGRVFNQDQADEDTACVQSIGSSPSGAVSS